MPSRAKYRSAVAAQVVGREEVAHAVGAGERRRPAGPGPGTAPTPTGPLAAGVGLEVQRPELVQAEDRLGIVGPRAPLAVGDLIELQHTVLLRLEVGFEARLLCECACGRVPYRQRGRPADVRA